MTKPRVAVVFVSYLKVPESRLLEHFDWNGTIYEEYGDQLRVYAVSDIERSLPDYAETVVFPIERLPVVAGQTRFSLTMTKNAGIAKAIQDGAEVIISTDVDIAFDPASFEVVSMASRMLSSAVIPIYRMAPSYAERASGRLDKGCTGTVSMTSGAWNSAKEDVSKQHRDAKGPYDERCVAYGADDGIILQAIERIGLGVVRNCEVAHIAHVPGDGARTPGSGAGTCWGRADGFNFDNFVKNSRIHRRAVRQRKNPRV